MVSDIKLAKFFSIILDCTSDVSHTDHLSVVIRIVSLKDEPHIKEHFYGVSGGRGDHGPTFGIPDSQKIRGAKKSFCRGQSYDNGANMRGKNKGVQARLQEVNPRALLVSCGAHTLNLVVADASESFVDATGYFGILH
jgi:hypothetical protein